MQKPDRKVASATISGAISVVIMSLLRQFDIDLGAEFASAATVLIMAVVSYFVPNPEPKPNWGREKWGR